MHEWVYILNSRDCHVNFDGEVMQANRLVQPFTEQGHRVVELLLETNEYDYDARQWMRKPQVIRVWELVKQAYFSNWPVGGKPVFMDGDPWNCHIDNIRALVFDRNEPGGRVVHARKEGWGYVFDRRYRGRVEIVETSAVFDTSEEAAKAVGGTKFGVSKALAGTIENHRGYHFRWV